MAGVISDTKSPNVRLMVEGVGSVRLNPFAVCYKSPKDKKQGSQPLVCPVVQADPYDDGTHFLTHTNESDTVAWKVKLKVNRRLPTFKRYHC